MLEIGEIEKEEKLHVNDMEYESNEGEDDMVDFGRTLTAGCCVKSWFKKCFFFFFFCQEPWIFL